jgi:hypothetical protein
MAYIPKAVRDKIPAEDFADQARRLYPIRNQQDLDDAVRLLGKAKNLAAVKAAIIRIAKRKGLSIPDAWKSDAKMADDAPASDTGTAIRDVAAFDLGAADPDGDWVYYRNSLLFRAGEYEDRDYSMTPEELWAAVEQFSGPVAVELDHLTTEGRPLIVEGQLGAVEDVRLSGDAHELYGTVKIPRWLDGVWDRHLAERGGTAKQVSCVWDRDTKTLRKLGLVVKGRVPDAALMGAYFAAHPDGLDTAFADVLAALFVAAHQTPHGRMALQAIHDYAARAGALCDPTASPAAGGVDYARDGPASPRFTAARERSHLQAIHDAAVKGGASCSISPRGTASMSDVPAIVPPPSKVKGRPMPLKEKFLALFGKAGAPPEDSAVDAFLADLTAVVKPAEPEKPAAVAATFADSPEAKALNAKVAELEAKLAAAPPASSSSSATFADSPEGKAMAEEVRAAREQARANAEKLAKFEDDNLLREIAAAAAAFADAEIKNLRALPAERPNLVALYTQAANDDRATPQVVTFAVGGEIKTGTRVEAIRAMCAARPKHSLYLNMLDDRDRPAGSAVFAMNRGDEATKADAAADAAAVESYLKSFDTGRAALALKAQNGTRS